MSKKEKVYCKNCQRLKVFSGSYFDCDGDPEVYICTIFPQTRDTWYDEHIYYVNAKERNKNNDCSLFRQKRTFLEKLKDFKEEYL